MNTYWSIGYKRKRDNFIWFLSHVHSLKLKEAKEILDEWVDAVKTSTTAEPGCFFVVPAVDGLLYMTNDQQLEQYHKNMVYERYF